MRRVPGGVAAALAIEVTHHRATLTAARPVIAGVIIGIRKERRAVDHGARQNVVPVRLYPPGPEDLPSNYKAFFSSVVLLIHRARGAGLIEGLGALMNHAAQQAGYRLLLVADLLDNFSRALGKAPITPE